jgi:hypothetical protein
MASSGWDFGGVIVAGNAVLFGGFHRFFRRT